MLKDIIKYAKARMPNITMGSILKVSLFSYRHKERMMTLNPYNDELLILKEKEVEDLLAISSLTNVGFVV